MRRNRRTRFGAVADDDVDDTGRQAGLERESGQRKRGEWGVLGRLHHDRVARRDRRANVHHEVRTGGVPRNDATDYAVRLP